MSNQSIRLFAEPVRRIDAGDIIGFYVPIGTPFEYPSRLCVIQNFTNAALMFSFDGVNDHFPLATHTVFELDITANSSVSEAYYIGRFTSIYVNWLGLPKSGAVYVSTFYSI